MALRGAAHLDRLISDAPASSPEALRVHGISPDLCHQKGRPGRKVLGELIDDLGTNPVEIVAHNAPFERAFLEAWAAREHMLLPEIHWICTLALSRRLLPKAPTGYRLGALATALGWRTEGLHRAAADAELTQRLCSTLESWEMAKLAVG